MIVATDGSCTPNPGRGGWAWVAQDGREGSGAEASTTNNQMELQAVLEAIRSLEGPLLILTDSRYTKDVFTSWLPVWKAKGRVHKQKNAELILAIERALRGREVTWEWVRGHNGHPLNEQADRLANQAATSLPQSPVTKK